MTSKRGLPKQFRPLFWDHRFSDISIENNRDLIIRRILSIGSWDAVGWLRNISIENNRDLIIRRILSIGSWDAVGWLRNELGDESLREWLISHNGRGLTPRQLRFWELVYNLPARKVNKWVQNAQRGIWAKR